MNPWLEIPLEDYEAHMSLPSIAQAQFLADCIGSLTADLEPSSIAIVGCSGGNGFDRISPARVRRVVGIDINPEYVAQAKKRFDGRFTTLELLVKDFTSRDCLFEPVDLVFAGLVFEYVDYRCGLASVRRFLKPGGYLSAVLQLPSGKLPAVSPSRYTDLNKLESIFAFVSPDEFERQAKMLGFRVYHSESTSLRSGKEFQEILFQLADSRKDGK